MLEVDFHAEHVTAGGVELELVVVGKPVVPRASGERFDGNLLGEPFHTSAIDISVSFSRVAWRRSSDRTIIVAGGSPQFNCASCLQQVGNDECSVMQGTINVGCQF